MWRHRRARSRFPIGVHPSRVTPARWAAVLTILHSCGSACAMRDCWIPAKGSLQCLTSLALASLSFSLRKLSVISSRHCVSSPRDRHSRSALIARLLAGLRVRTATWNADTACGGGCCAAGVLLQCCESMRHGLGTHPFVMCTHTQRPLLVARPINPGCISGLGGGWGGEGRARDPRAAHAV